MGLGAQELYVPFAAVEDVISGERVVLNCVKDECRNLYANRPAELQG
jgi:hypothetical protein